MKKVGRSEFDSLLNSNVCEIIFVRRRPERAPSRPLLRRMICTNSSTLLNSENGIRSLNFHPPKGPKQVDEVIHNLVVVWDIFMQDYRNVSMDQCYLVQAIPDDDRFWNYFNNVLYPMSAKQKMNYMDSGV